MGARLGHLRAVAAALAGHDGVVVVPDPPQAALCQVHLRTDLDGYRERALRLAEDERAWAWEHPAPTDRPDWLMVELHASENLMAFTPTDAARMISGLASA
jgi:hypothetical protein